MLYVHKQSDEAIHAWSAIRMGGPNNIAPHAGKYLVLLNAEAVRRGGVWHYIFEFDSRDSLEMNPLATAVLGLPAAAAYRDCMNWQTWLGDEYALISPHHRWDILHAPLEAHSGDAMITDMREMRGGARAVEPLLLDYA